MITKNLKTSITNEEEFEEHILQMSLKKPTRAYNFFLKEMKQNKLNSSNDITNVSHKFAKKWSNLSDKEKKKYTEMEIEDQQRYKEHLSYVKKYILEKPLREFATAFTIYVDEFIKKAIEQGMNPKEARKEARKNWKSLSEEQRNIFEEKKEKHKELYQALKKAKGRVSGYTLYIKDELMQAKEKNERITLMDCGEKWKKLNQSIKEKYIIYADEIREERERLRDLYEITFGLKPKRPVGAYKFFMMEQAKEGKLDGKNPFIESAKLWNSLGQDKKERYFKIAKKRQLAYIIKKEEYNSSIRKINGRAPSEFNLFVADMRDKIVGDLPPGGMFQYCFEKWQKVSDEIKLKYKKLAEVEKIKFDGKRKEEIKDKIEPVKKPIPPYNKFVSERFNKIKEETGHDIKEIMKKISDEWNGMNKELKQKYIIDYQNENKILSQQLKNSDKNEEKSKKSNESNIDKTPAKYKSTNKKRRQSRSNSRKKSILNSNEKEIFSNNKKRKKSIKK